MSDIIAHLIRPRNFWLFIMAFTLFGLVLIYNASLAESLTTFGHPWHYVQYQVVWFVVGWTLYAAMALIPHTWWRRLSPVIFGGVIVLLILVLIPGIGVETLGAQRRLSLGPVQIQPAELAKFAIVLFYAAWLEKHQRFAPFLFFTSLIFGLVILQPNLSTASIMAALATLLYFFAGGNVRPLLWFGTVGGLIVLALIMIAPYRRERLTTFLNPASDPLGKSYHIRQITIALGRGGWWGQGIGFSKQKQQYIPEVSSDAIFAVHAEETGFVGSLALIGAYVVLLSVGYMIAQQQTEPFPYLLAVGITTWISLHVLLNLAAMVALIPLTGIPLPLISYGGSSFISFMSGLGLLHRLLAETTSQRPTSPARITTRHVHPSSTAHPTQAKPTHQHFSRHFPRPVAIRRSRR